jgi:hypothetical protein
MTNMSQAPATEKKGVSDLLGSVAGAWLMLVINVILFINEVIRPAHSNK